MLNEYLLCRDGGRSGLDPDWLGRHARARGAGRRRHGGVNRPGSILPHCFASVAGREGRRCRPPVHRLPSGQSSIV